MWRKVDMMDTIKAGMKCDMWGGEDRGQQSKKET